jgi:hypothetical protein
MSCPLVPVPSNRQYRKQPRRRKTGITGDIRGFMEKQIVSLNCRDELGWLLSVVAFSMK